MNTGQYYSDKTAVDDQVQSNLQYNDNHTIYMQNYNLTTITI